MVSIFENPLATPAQLASSPSRADGIPEDLETRLRFAGCRLIQAAGILLELPQTSIATAIVLFQRFYLISSMRQHNVKDTGMASVYLCGKLTEHPKRPRDIVNVYAYLLSPASPLTKPHPPTPTTAATSTSNDDEDQKDGGKKEKSKEFYVSESSYANARTQILSLETLILRSISFHTHVALPYTLAFNYLQSFNVLHHDSSTMDEAGDTLQPRQHNLLAVTTFAYLTDLLASASQPYLTHQPHEIAVAAVYLAARDHEVKLPEAWWEVWDVDREVLGFLVVVARGGTYNVGGVKRPVYISDDVVEKGGDDDGIVVPVGTEGLEKELQRMREME